MCSIESKGSPREGWHPSALGWLWHKHTHTCIKHWHTGRHTKKKRRERKEMEEAEGESMSHWLWTSSPKKREVSHVPACAWSEMKLMISVSTSLLFGDDVHKCTPQHQAHSIQYPDVHRSGISGWYQHRHSIPNDGAGVIIRLQAQHGCVYWREAQRINNQTDNTSSTHVQMDDVKYALNVRSVMQWMHMQEWKYNTQYQSI